MEPTNLQAIVRSEVEDAVFFVEEEISPKRAESLEYYRGDAFGNEEDGRSQVVARVLRQAVGDTLPSLMRVFFGSDRAVEFVPNGPEDTAISEQATDYINHIILRDNPGVEVFHTAFKDSLYQINGIVKYWKDDAVEVSYHDFTDLDDAAIGALMSEEGVEIVEASSRFQDEEAAGQMMAMGMQPPQVHDVRIKRVRSEPRFRIKAVPGEEFIISRDASTIDDARVVGHRALLPFSEVVAMGYDPDLVEGHIHHSDTFQDSEQAYTRRQDQGGYYGDDTKNPSERRVLYTEVWLRIDADGDNLAEMRKFCCIGDSYEIVNGEMGEPVDNVRPFVSFCPDPEPHLFFGSDLAEQTKDLQLLESNIWRRMLDSLGDSIYPRTVMVEGQADIDTVQNTETGAIVIEYAPGMVREMVKPFVGKEAFPMLEQVQKEKDRRIGMRNTALDADALQSTTKLAVNAQVQAAAQRVELIARLYAESGMRRLFKGLLRLVTKHQNQPRMVRLRNEWVPVDPRVWDANMDVTVNVGLGNGLMEERVQVLQQVLGVQREVLSQLGPSNPMVGFGHVRNTLGKILEQSGYKDTTQFFKPVPLDFEPPPPEPKPTPEELLAQIEREKTMANRENDMMKADLERDKLLADIELRVMEINAKHNAQYTTNMVKYAIEQNKLKAKGADA
jgi:hypothetical protein